MIFQYKDQISGKLSIYNSHQWSENSTPPLSSYTIIINTGSEMQIDVDLEQIKVPQNGLCFLNPGSYMTSVQSSDDSHFIVEFNSAFYCLELHDKEVSCNGLLFGATKKIPILNCTEDEARENNHVVQMMISEFQHKDSTQGDMLRLLLKRLIIMCVRIGRMQLFNESEPLMEDTDIIRNYQALVEKHFRKKHKVAEYADLMFKSPKTLSNTFNKLGEPSPLQIIQNRIILEAKRLMHHTDKTIKEITYDLGFSEPAQFSRLFKKITGKSPSDFQVKIV